MAFEAQGRSPGSPPNAIVTQPPAHRQRRRRVPLGASRRRLSYDLRLRFWLCALAVPLLVCAGMGAWLASQSMLLTVAAIVGTAVVAAIALSSFFEQITRPLQTLANVVSALREEDFSFRARGARRGDSLGDLALEINFLAGTLQTQRGAARDALTLAERVMGAMRTPVLAFAADGTLRLLNPAAESAFALPRREALGRSAQSLGLQPLFRLADGAIHAHPAVSSVAGEMRWSLHRSNFRLGGVPHELFVLSDVNAALREEERIAWQRLVRVLSHEINNSLTPITSIAGSLRSRLPLDDAWLPPEGSLDMTDLRRGLSLIQDRALSLHHFLQAYQQLSRLPRPQRQSVAVTELLHRVAHLETRIPVIVHEGPELSLHVDPAQMEQLLINLLRNAVDAALSVTAPQHEPSVQLSWMTQAAEFVLRVEDNGPGLTDTANLFVPFYTTKPEGSGIGLPLAKQIAAGHDGTLSLANSEDHSGCAAELRLPLMTA